MRIKRLSVGARETLCASLPLAILLLGCGGNDTDTDGTGGSTAATVTITGTWIDRRLTEAGQTLVPVDLSNQTVSADFEVSPGHWKTQSGSGEKSGNFTISGVPDGPFYLNVSRDGFQFGKYYTSEHVIDLGSYVTSRSDAVQIQPAQTVPVAISSNLVTPWTTSNSLQLLSIDANGSSDSAALIDTGATSVNGLMAEWQSGGMADASKGDTTYLYEASYHTSAHGQSYWAVDGAASTTALTVNPTVKNPTPVSFDMVATDTNENSVVQAHTGAFRSLTLDNPLVSKSGSEDSPTVNIIAGAHAADSGLVGSYPGLIEARPKLPDGDVDLTLAYGNPFSSSWTEALEINFHSFAAFALNGHPPELGGVTLQTVQTVAMSPALTDVSPMLGPVRNISINDKDASVPTDLTAEQLTLSWDPPALGTPTLYEIDAYPLDDPPCVRVVVTPAAWGGEVRS